MGDLAGFLIKNGLSILGTAVAGPLGGAAVDFLAGKLGLSDKSAEAVHETLAGMKPEQLVAMKQADYEFQEHMAELGIKLDLGQIGINTEEAKVGQNIKTDWMAFMIAAWRPFIGWTGGIALGYNSIILPASEFIAKVGFHYTGAFPEVNLALLGEVLLGLLGMSYHRSMDKKNGVANGD